VHQRPVGIDGRIADRRRAIGPRASSTSDGDPDCRSVYQQVGARWALETGPVWGNAQPRTQVVVIGRGGPNGSIDPGAPVTVSHSAIVHFTVTPDADYAARVGGTSGGTLVGATCTTSPILRRLHRRSELHRGLPGGPRRGLAPEQPALLSAHRGQVVMLYDEDCLDSRDGREKGLAPISCVAVSAGTAALKRKPCIRQHPSESR